MDRTGRTCKDKRDNTVETRSKQPRRSFNIPRLLIEVREVYPACNTQEKGILRQLFLELFPAQISPASPL